MCYRNATQISHPDGVPEMRGSRDHLSIVDHLADALCSQVRNERRPGDLGRHQRDVNSCLWWSIGRGNVATWLGAQAPLRTAKTQSLDINGAPLYFPAPLLALSTPDATSAHSTALHYTALRRSARAVAQASAVLQWMLIVSRTGRPTCAVPGTAAVEKKVEGKTK